MGEPFGQRRRRIGLELSVGKVAQAVTVSLDQPPAGGAEPGIEAEDSYIPLPPAGGVRGGTVPKGMTALDMPSPCPSRKREGS